MRQRGAGGRLKAAAWGTALGGVALVVSAVALFFVTHRGVIVMGQSMEPTYRQGEQLVVESDVDPDGIRRGDVLLVLVPERYRNAPVLQRVVGTGGDHVVSDGERVTVNGEPLDEPYVKEERLPSSLEPYDVRVPEGRLFLLGDNRANANDSRFFLDERSGSVATSAVLGRVREGLPPAVTTTGALGAVLVLAGAVLGIVAGRRSRGSLRAAV
ncbi:signal peptidase I [Streptomyces sp. NPDC035033]|uniref:signal peptidase I n=1 Tax=Streptomyces sp. NPDC035033 TaxID=3155368 RepID=UPI0033FC95F5